MSAITLLLAEKPERTLDECVCEVLANYWPKGLITVKAASVDKLKENCPVATHPQLICNEGVIQGSGAVRMFLCRALPQLRLGGSGPFEEAKIENFWEGIAMAVRVGGDQKGLTMFLNAKLQTSTYLVGERMTVADMMAAAFIQQQVGAKGLADLPHLTRWFKTVTCRKEFASAHFPTSDAAAPAAAPPATDEAEDEPPKKKKNPLDDLPQSSMNLDEWKRTYSNTKNLSEAMTWFWDHFDAAGWSFWFMKYDKTPDELKVAFLASNHLSGFLQRVDGNFRKYSFGVVNIVGTTGDFDVQGVWMFRGQEIPFEMTDHPSFEYQKFRKLDHTKPEDKELIRAYWTENDVVEGKPIEDCKVWK